MCLSAAVFPAWRGSTCPFFVSPSRPVSVPLVPFAFLPPYRLCSCPSRHIPASVPLRVSPGGNNRPTVKKQSSRRDGTIVPSGGDTDRQPSAHMFRRRRARTPRHSDLPLPPPFPVPAAAPGKLPPVGFMRPATRPRPSADCERRRPRLHPARPRPETSPTRLEEGVGREQVICVCRFRRTRCASDGRRADPRPPAFPPAPAY